MAYDFNGTNQFLINDSWTAVSTFPFTMAAWVNLDTTTATSVIGLSKTGVSGVAVATPRDSADGTKFGAGLFNGSSYDQSLAASSYSTSVWSHIVAVYTSATSRLVYFNGSAGTANTTNLPFVGINRVTIGANKQGSTTASYVDGRISEVAIWSVGITADEANSLGKGFKPHRIRPQSLVFYAPLVADIRDFARGLSLTNTNTATVANHTRVY